MKKRLALVLSLALLLSVLAMAGCSEENASGICLIVSGHSSQGGKVASTKRGVKQLEVELQLFSNFVECEGDNLSNCIAKNAPLSKYIIIVGFVADDVIDTASFYPDTKFIIVEGYSGSVSEHENVLCIDYDDEEIAFLVGYAAEKVCNGGVLELTDDLNGAVREGIIKGAEYARNDRNGVTIANRGRELFLNERLELSDIDGNSIFCAEPDVGNSVYDIIRLDIKEHMWNGGTVWKADLSSGYMSLEFSEETVFSELRNDIERVTSRIISGEIRIKRTNKN